MPDIWPNIMVLPEGEDFAKMDWESACGTRGCAAGWALTAFGEKVPVYGLPMAADEHRAGSGFSRMFPVGGPMYQFCETILKELGANKAGLKEFRQVWGEGGYSHSADGHEKGLFALSDAYEYGTFLGHEPTEEEFAAAWLRAAKRCGYDVSQPIVIK